MIYKCEKGKVMRTEQAFRHARRVDLGKAEVRNLRIPVQIEKDIPRLEVVVNDGFGLPLLIRQSCGRATLLTAGIKGKLRRVFANTAGSRSYRPRRRRAPAADSSSAAPTAFGAPVPTDAERSRKIEPK